VGHEGQDDTGRWPGGAPPSSLATTGQRQRVRIGGASGGCRPNASRAPCCGCCVAKTWNSSRRDPGVTVAELSAWRDAFLTPGEAALKTRAPDGRDVEIGRLKAKVGEFTMGNELIDA
jgi:hypothetical protein